uniref:Peptidase S1 domain-containing protein n=1 Tax=Scylla olivacea TaxID=85551 RepID=A0A0P4WDJ3_SCYOL
MTDEFPWQARQETNWNIHVCGSIVIDFSWVMTAAHCLYYYEPSQLLIVAGDYDRLEDEGENVTAHEAYSGAYRWQQWCQDKRINQFEGDAVPETGRSACQLIRKLRHC